MKTIFRRLLLTGTLLVVAITLGACDSITDMNQNDPNNPSEAQVPFLLTNAQRDLAANYWGSFTLGRFGIYYSQYWSATTYTSEPRFNYPTGRPGSNSGMWNTYYYVLNDLQQMIRIMRDEPERASGGGYGDPQDVIAIAKIQQAWVWQTLTDIYGAIPLDSALAGRDNVQPGYASQERVYQAIIDSLTTAGQSLSGAPALSGADLLFGGNTERWRQFANGLKMRYAIRASCAQGTACDMGTAPDFAVTAFQEAFNASSFTDASGYQRALMPFSDSSPYQNPLYVNAVIEGRQDWAISKTITDQMNPTNDPRRPAYAELSPGGDYEGLPYGLQAGQLAEYTGDFSFPSDRVEETATAPAILYTESEEYFMLAEAAERGWISGDGAESYYQEGIRASLDYWDASDEADDFIERVPYDNDNDWAPAPESGEPIWTQTLGIQKWIALYMQGVQGWSIYRRLDFDNVFVSPPENPAGDFNAEYPLRLPYPNEEPSLNGQSWQEAVDTYYNGEDTQGQPLWWDDGEVGALKTSVAAD